MKTSSVRFPSLLFFALITVGFSPCKIDASDTIALPLVSVRASDPEAAETPGNNGTFLFTRYGSLDDSLRVSYSIGGTASNGVDYAAIPDGVTFASGSSNATLTIQPIDDALVEGNESVILTLRTNSTYRFETSAATATITIFDNDNSPPNIHLFNPTNYSKFAAPTNILLQAETSDGDGWLRRVEFYRGDDLIGTVPGQDVNRIYSFVWTNPPPGTYALTARAIDNFEARATSAPVNVAITAPESNTLPVVTIQATDPNASEISPLLDIPENPGIFRVTRNHAWAQPLTVNYRVSGTASNGVDYVALPGSVTIPSNEASADIFVEVIDDTLVEGNEMVVLNLLTNSTYLLGTPREAGVVIADNDHSNIPPTVRITQPTNGTIFFAPADITIFADASDTDGFVETVEFFSGTNILGIVTNNPASASPVNPFHVTWTNVPMGVYTFTANATDDSGAVTTSEPIHIYVLKKTVELPIVTIRATDPNAAEIPTYSTMPLNPGIFSVMRSLASTQPLVVNYAVEGTASNGVDYGKLNGTLTIPANESSANIYVVPIDDTVVEGTETVMLILKTNAAYSVGGDKQATVYIEDNDHSNSPPSVHITSPTNNAVFVAPANISVAAEATDNGHVVRVDFFAGDKLIGSDTNAPFGIVWENVAQGTYNLSAKATDDEGASSFSPAIHITVRSPNEVAFVKRDLPLWYVPTVKLVVTLHAAPPDSAASFSVVDHPPTNWAVHVVSEGGSYNPTTRTVSFGPFNNHNARTLIYEATPPAGETGEKHFSGTATANDLTTPIGGVDFILPAPLHPADNNPANFHLGGVELSNYVGAWKRCEHWPISPDPIPISYVTRAGYLFASGEGYHISTQYPTPFPPLLWVPGNVEPTSEPIGEVPWTTDGVGHAIGSMPTNYIPGTPFQVTLTVTPSSNTLAYAVEDRPPEGWGVTNISEGGIFCAVTHKVRWGLFSDDHARSLTYQVIPFPTATVREAQFAEVASFNGIDVPITGQRVVRYAPATIASSAKMKSITQLPNGDRLMTFAGGAGVCYIIEATTNLIDWVPLEGLLNNDGALQYIDGSGNLEQKFYRAVPLP